MFPIRCFTCNKVIGQYERKYYENRDNPKAFFERHGISRYCCRRMFLGHVNLSDRVLAYEDEKKK